MKRGVLAALMLVAATASGQDEDIEAPAAWDEGFNPKVQDYEVVKGDTLWAISARIVGDPFMWPKVWSLNPEITNPHWIYPGDRIRFYQPDVELPSQSELIAGQMDIREEASAEELPPTQTAPQESVQRVEIVDTAQDRRAGPPTRRFLSRFITDKELQEAGTLTNAAPDKILLSTGDLVFLEFPSSKRPAKGTRLLTFRTQGKVYHPVSDAHRGYVTQITGVLQVLSRKDDTVTKARVVENLFELERGQQAVPFDDNLSIKLVPVAATKKVEGTVMAVRDTDTLISGQDELVYIDRGKNDGLVRGNQLMVYGQGDEFTEKTGDQLSYWIGVLQILDAQDKSSTCLVLQSRREIVPGARVQTLVRGGG